MYRATKPLELVHGDLCGPITPCTIAQNRYIFVLIDDHSHYMWSLLLKEKGEAFSKFKNLIKNETGVSIKTLRTDRGGEFTSQEFQNFCDNCGIKRHLTAPYTPQQNGVVERRNRTLMEMTRSILKHMSVPNYLWGEAIRHATYLINRVATRALNQQTPYEVFKSKNPNVEHLRIFGCIGYAKVQTPHLRKLDDRTRVLVHLGTEPGSKAYRLFDPNNRKIVVSRDVVFDEYNGWKWRNLELGKFEEPGMFRLSFGEHGNHGIRNDEHAETGENNNKPMEDGEGNEDDEVLVEQGSNTSKAFPEQETRSDERAHNTQEPLQPPLRRTTRQSNPPKYLEDYILLAEEESEKLLVVFDDSSFKSSK